MRYEKHFYEGRNSGLQYYEIRNDLKPLVLLHAGRGQHQLLLRHAEARAALPCVRRGLLRPREKLHDASRYNVADIGNAVIDFI